LALPDSSPLITTVIPTYRRPKLLRRAIKSVLAQTYPHFQVCIYDNASGDETEAVVREMSAEDPRIRYHRHPENIGGFKNFVYGMERVETPFFSLLSDDDVLLPEFFQKAIDGFGKHPEAMLSGLATIHMDDGGQVWSVSLHDWQEGFYAPPEGLLAMLKYRHPDWTGILFRRDVLHKVGFLDEETNEPADLDFELRIAARWPIVISREPGAILVLHRDSVTSSVRLDSLWPAWQKIIRNLMEDENISLDVRAHARDSLLRFFRRHYFALGGLAFVVNKDWRQAEQAAAILRDSYHRPAQALLLRGLSWVSRKVPPAYWLMSGLNALRKSLRSFKKPLILSRYAGYASLLDLAN